ncbi:TolC family protein [Elusimicrobiota bacterium]
MNTKLKFLPLFFLVSSLVCAKPAFAEDQLLDTCLKIAESREKKLVLANEQINLSDIRVKRSIRKFFPSAAAQLKVSKGETANAEYQAEQYMLRASQPIYEGGRLRANYKYDNFMLLSAKYNYTKTREEFFGSVKLAYYELLSKKMEFRTLKQAYEEVEKLLKKVKVEYKSKAISQLDLVESENFRDKVRDLMDSTEEGIGLATQKLTLLLNVNGLDEVPTPMPESLPDDIASISFTLKECSEFALVNSIDLKIANLQIQMASQKKKISRSKIIPKFYLDGSYGRDGEAFVTQPLDLTTVWSVIGKMSWGLWGNSMETSIINDKTDPKTIVDYGVKVENTTSELKVGFLDDMDYFVDSKESSVSFVQSESDHQEEVRRITEEVHANYYDYTSSYRDIKTYRNEITLRKRKLALMKKKNKLYEVPTVQVMEESWEYAETIAAHAKALYRNYAAVTNLEKITLVALR